MTIEKISAKKVKDIFCGNHHSFLINDKDHVFSWGLNNHGQLGIGNKFNTSVPTRVRELDPSPGDGDFVVMVDGGEHHSIALTRLGAVYTWGRNDEGQVGLGDIYGDYRKKKAREEMERMEQEEQERQQKEA